MIPFEERLQLALALKFINSMDWVVLRGMNDQKGKVLACNTSGAGRFARGSRKRLWSHAAWRSENEHPTFQVLRIHIRASRLRELFDKEGSPEHVEVKSTHVKG